MNKYIIFSLILFCFSPCSNAQDNTDVNYGFELDALPYLTGGYYISGWVGKDKLRVRGIVASVNFPKFAIEAGFEDNKLEAYALVVDYFPSQNFSGVWYGGGIEFWDSEIKSENENITSEYSNFVVTAGGGYIWYFHKNFYLNPWGAIHGIVSGDGDVNVGSRVFKPKKVTGEISLKVGFKY